MQQVKQPFVQIADLDGSPLQGGSLYFGQPNLNPETNPITVYWDSAATQPAAQPIMTMNGYPVRNGNIADLYAPNNYSLTARNKSGKIIFYKPNVDNDASLIGTSAAPGGLWADVQGFINTIISSIGSSVVGFIQAGAGAVVRDLQSKCRERVSVVDFGADPTGILDSTSALQAARDYISTTKSKLIFPAGTYKYSVSPNWAIPDAEVIAEGRVVLQYTGVGDAVIFDAGSGTETVFNVRFGAANKFHVNAPSTAQNGCFVRSVHHSHIGLNVHGCGASSSGLLVKFAVCTQFDVTVSANEGGWYAGAKPAAGVTLDLRNSGETVSYCLFPNPIIEAPTIGIQLINTLGNVFLGGTSEGCSNYGVYAALGAIHDRFIGTDFEVNTIADVYCQSLGTVFQDCDTYTQIAFGTTARRCRIDGGEHQSILFDTGSVGCAVNDAVYNRFISTGNFVDAGTGSEVLNLRNGSNVMYLTATTPFNPGTIAVNNAVTFDLTVTGAKLGDFAIASCTSSLAGLSVTAVVTAVNNVKVSMVNNITGSPVTPATGVLKVRLLRGV